MMTSTSKKMAAVVLAVTVAMSLSACSNMSKRDRNTAIGAGAGAIGGAVLTDGSALGTLGGAAVIIRAPPEAWTFTIHTPSSAAAATARAVVLGIS